MGGLCEFSSFTFLYNDKETEYQRAQAITIITVTRVPSVRKSMVPRLGVCSSLLLLNDVFQWISK